MLVLTRKLMERLYIGDEICITVVRVEGGQVRLGIDAPRHIPVVRAELTPRRAADKAAPDPLPSPAAAGERTPAPEPPSGVVPIRSRPAATPGIGIPRRVRSR